jgi:uncharacterized membrane protein SpoIIM required for sporulation
MVWSCTIRGLGQMGRWMAGFLGQKLLFLGFVAVGLIWFRGGLVAALGAWTLASAVVAPGRLRRTLALRQTAPEALKLVMGAALMLLLAAFVEAFWSSSGVALTVKYAVAAVLWSAVALYLWQVGRFGPR